MKHLISKYILLAILWTLTMSIAALGQQKEVLIIGTMHTVPKIVGNSYKPLLIFARNYKPQAIYVEVSMPSDTLSQRMYSKRFVRKSDSLSTSFKPDSNIVKSLKAKELTEMSREDYAYLSKVYLLSRDQANYEYYDYLSKYGLMGSPKPLRNENGDLNFKLAIAMNLKEIYSMDFHQTDNKYYKAYDQAIEDGETTGDLDKLTKLNKKLRRKQILPAMLGRLGRFTNRPETLQAFHLVNTFRFAEQPTQSMLDVGKYWDLRNEAMAEHIVSQVRAKPYTRNIVTVGAGHVVSLKQIIEQKHPDIRVITMYDFR